MSIKTLRKRIALVAVSALGAGLISVVSTPVANATVAAADFAAAPGNTTVSCFDSGQTAGVESIGILASNTVLFTGSAAIGTTETASLTLTGPGTFTNVTAAGSTPVTTTVADDRKSIKMVGGSSKTNLPTSITVTPSGVGTITVTYRDITSTASLKATTYIYVVASCSDYATLSVADSYSNIETTSSSAFTSSTATDVNEAGTDLIANRGTAYIKAYLVDKYGNDVSGASTNALIATSTGDATIGINGASSTAKTAVLAGTGTNLEDPVVYVTCPDTDKATTSTVKLAYNGVEAYSKTIKCAGDVAKVTATLRIANLTAGGANVGAISYQVFDDAGNALRSKAASLYTTTATGSLISATGSATSGYTTTGATTGSAGRIDVATGSAQNDLGTGTAVIRVTKADGVTKVSSDRFTVINSTTTKSKYTASLDKATYAMGEIITLTISATDPYGLPVADGAVLGSAAADLNISVSGATAVTSPAHGDTSVGGKWEYKYTAGTTDGSWVAGVQLKAVTTDTAKQVTYTIKPSGAVSNAEVLAAIVKLIASINKQIRALQKSLRR